MFVNCLKKFTYQSPAFLPVNIEVKIAKGLVYVRRQNKQDQDVDFAHFP